MSQTYNLGKVALTPRGAFNPNTSYERLDIVSNNGSSYLVLQPCIGVTPPNATYYQLISSKGDTGSTGAAGTIRVGTVQTVAASQPTTIVNSGTSNNAVFDFQLAIVQESITNAQIDSLF